MHKLLGKPIATSRYWGIDLFRDTSSETKMGFVVIILPFPAGIFKDDINQYILVAYDQNDVAMALQQGIHCTHPFWRGPIREDAQTLSISAGDFTFSVDLFDRLETLLVSGRQRDAYLELAKTSAVLRCE